MGLLLAVCALAGAQDTTGDRVVVPARNSTHARLVKATLHSGSLTVKTYAGKEVIVETPNSGSRNSERTVDGMRRLDLPARGLAVEEEDNVVTVHTGLLRNNDLLITVPTDTSLQLQSHSGPITVEGVNGEIDVTTYNGHITLNNVSGTVVAHSYNAPINVTVNRVDTAKPLSFSTFNGSIDVTLPADLKANLKLNTRGEIWSDFDFKLGGNLITQKNGTSDGKFRVVVDRTVAGTINGGGVDITFHSYNGRVYIRKKK
jgi:hypothetical protein